ncbi:MAG: hypothetical protein N2A99_03125 [Carnobacterium alterfunditum]
MISLDLFLSEKGKDSIFIYGRNEESGKANSMYRGIEEEFADHTVKGGPEDQPFIYLSISPIRERNSGIAASIVPQNLNFKVEMQEAVVKFMREYK